MPTPDEPRDPAIQASRKGLAVVRAKADIQHNGAVLKRPHQLAIPVVPGVELVEVGVLVPRRHEQPRAGLWRKRDGADGVVWRGVELELGCWEG
jgi:hypothetical protein